MGLTALFLWYICPHSKVGCHLQVLSLFVSVDKATQPGIRNAGDVSAEE